MAAKQQKPSDPRRSKNPARRAEKTVAKDSGLGLWVKAFLALSFVGSVAATLWLTWGFKGTLGATPILTALIVGMLSLSAAAFIADRFVYGQRSGVSARTRAKKVIIIVIVILIAFTVLGTALTDLSAPATDPSQPTAPVGTPGG